EFAVFGAALGSSPADALLEPCRDRLLDRMLSSVIRPGSPSVTEEYTVFRVHRLEDSERKPLAAADISAPDIARLLLGESRPLSAMAQKEMISPRLSYFEDDLTVLTWG